MANYCRAVTKSLRGTQRIRNTALRLSHLNLGDCRLMKNLRFFPSLGEGELSGLRPDRGSGSGEERQKGKDHHLQTVTGFLERNA